MIDHLQRFSLIFFGLAFLVLTSCESHFAETNTDWESDCWSMHDTVHLSFESVDTAAVYRLYFPMTFTEDYPFNNLYLRALVTSPTGDENLLPARFELSDVGGNWYSEPNGEEISFELGLSDGLKFNQKGRYTIRLFHYMRDEMLCGTRSAGIVLEEVELVGGS